MASEFKVQAAAPGGVLLVVDTLQNLKVVPDI
jgi:hypothetical protein